MIGPVSWGAPNSQASQRSEEGRTEDQNQKRRVNRGFKACSKQNCVFPEQEQMFLSPDAPLRKPGEGPSPRLALLLPPGAVMRPRPTGPVLLSPGKVASWKFCPSPAPSQSTLFLEVKRTGPQYSLWPEQDAVFGSYLPWEGSVLLADRISVPAQHSATV